METDCPCMTGASWLAEGATLTALMTRSRVKLKRIGDTGRPCLTPEPIEPASVWLVGMRKSVQASL